jgi:hypothetical protein
VLKTAIRHGWLDHLPDLSPPRPIARRARSCIGWGSARRVQAALSGDARLCTYGPPRSSLGSRAATRLCAVPRQHRAPTRRSREPRAPRYAAGAQARRRTAPCSKSAAKNRFRFPA